MSDGDRSGRDAEPDDFVIDEAPVGRLPSRGEPGDNFRRDR
ncbi:hypothetical protein [Amycolatopsis sp. NPDC051071]